MQAIRRNGSASVSDLARMLEVSHMTIHRDLEHLVAAGLIERVRGGARTLPSDLHGPRSAAIETAWDKRVQQNSEAKAAIAVPAAEWVEDYSTIFIDASSTGLALAKQLMSRPPNELTIVTNSPAIVAEPPIDAIHVVVIPGEIDQVPRAIAGSWSVEFLSQIRVEQAFISAAGIDLDQGLTTSRRTLADLLNAARASASRTVGLIDSSKFGRASLVKVAAARDLNVIVVDSALPPDVVQNYRDAGVRLEIARKPESALDGQLVA